MKRKKYRDRIEMVLQYGLENHSEKSEKLAELLRELKVPTIFIQPEQLNQSIGFLCGMGGFEEDSQPFLGEVPGEECIVIRGFTQNKMDQLLRGLKMKGISIDLKAVVTEYNRSWKLIDLLTELKREHEEMRKYRTEK